MIRRIVAAVIACVLGACALWMFFGLWHAAFNAVNVIFGGWACLIATVAILCGWFALRSHLPQSRLHIRRTTRGAWIVSGIAFAAGFVGPAIFEPKANQGPLLGIFVTGPMGFVLGAIIGWLYGRFRREAGVESV